MKKVFTFIMVLATIATMFTTPGFAAGKEAIGEITAPVSKAGLYDLDPDQDPKSVWSDSVTEQVTIVDYALNGWVVGSSSKSDMLVLGKESQHISVYGTEVLKEAVMEKEVGEMLTLAKDGKIAKEDFQLWFAQYIMGRVTRLENVNGVLATTLNVETYSKKIHGDPIARIQVGPKDWSYWNIYERTLKDGSVVWVLCRQPATNNDSKKPDPTKQPDPDPTPAPTNAPGTGTGTGHRKPGMNPPATSTPAPEQGTGTGHRKPGQNPADETPAQTEVPEQGSGTGHRKPGAGAESTPAPQGAGTGHSTRNNSGNENPQDNGNAQEGGDNFTGWSTGN